MNVNVQFSRELLKSVMKEVRRLTTSEQRKSVWVYKYDLYRWEFHGPDGFYWYGQADNAWDARVQGWESWLKTMVNNY